MTNFTFSSMFTKFKYFSQIIQPGLFLLQPCVVQLICYFTSCYCIIILAIIVPRVHHFTIYVTTFNLAYIRQKVKVLNSFVTAASYIHIVDCMEKL